MRLDEIRDLVTSSAPHWAKLETGPLYREGWTVYSSGGESNSVPRWHHEAAVYRDDVDLTLQWGMSDHGDWGDDDRSFEWARTFIDTKVRSFFVDVFWRGVLVDRYVMAHVNGGHGLVPMPRASQDDGHYPTVNGREVQIARLITALEGGYDDPIEGVLNQAGFRVEHA